MKLISARLTLAGVLFVIAVSACVVAPTAGYDPVVAYEAPPPVRFEVVGVAPAPGYFWVNGAWFWGEQPLRRASRLLAGSAARLPLGGSQLAPGG